MIDDVKDTKAFFQKIFLESLRDLRATVRPEVEVYVVFLLDEMGRLPYHEEPLGPMLLSSRDPERTAVLKEVGDRSLFISGFFGERLKERGLSTSYYASLGSSAYGELANRYREPFESMASHIVLLQRALKGVREACDAMGLDSWSVHKAWLQNRSPALERRMARLGMFILPDGEA